MIAKEFRYKSPERSSIRRLVNYITHDQGKASRIGEVFVSNCHSSDPYDAALEIQNAQDMNTKARGDKTMHVMISLRPGEDVNSEVWRKIECAVCEGLGLSEHQRVAVVHRDTGSSHLHIAISKVEPKTRNLARPAFSKRKLLRITAQLERRFNLEADNHIPGKKRGENKAQDMERMSGNESFVSWLRRNALAELKSAQTWSDFHEVCAKFGVEIRKRGNGLVFVGGEDQAVKASTVDGELSKGKIEKALGEFIAVKVQGNGRAGEKVKKTPVGMDKKKPSPLHAAYTHEMDALREKTNQAVASIQERRDKRLHAAQLEYKAAVAAAKVHGSGGVRREGQRGASLVYKARVKAIRSQAREEIARYFQANEKKTWLAWLQREAEGGNAEAVKALQARAYSDAKRGTNALFGNRKEEAPLLSEETIEAVTKTGTIIYRVGSSDVIKDRIHSLDVTRESSSKTLVMALRMAQQRYGDKLFVTGSDEFKTRLVEAAAAARLRITFDNPSLESKRKELVKLEWKRINEQKRAEKGLKR